MKFVMKFFLCTLLLCSIVFPALAQNATTSLRGVVKDPSSAVVPNATITLTNPATGASYHTASNSSGFYAFPVVEPAHYDITVASTGFAAEKSSIDLLVNAPATLDFALTVSRTTVTVNVNSAAEDLNQTDATEGNSVGNSVIQALPMEGRNPISLLSLQPGVLYIGQDPSTADSRQGAVAGGRSDQGNITLDGLDDNDQINGTAFAGILRSTLDSTEEFRVTTSNGTSEAGRTSGAQINLVTKSGTNQYHGALYEYYRPTNTVANAYFNKYDQLSSGEPNVPQKYVLNTFGGALGAPIIKDRLFYFFNYEGQRQAIDQIVGATVPTTTFMQGELQYLDPSGNQYLLTSSQVAQLDSACSSNTFNGQPVCPNGPGPNQAVLNYYAHVPAVAPVSPGSAILGDGLNSGALFFASPAPSTLNTSILRIDYDLNSKNRIFVRGNLQKDTASSAENLPGQPPSTFSDDNTKGLAAGDSWTPSARIVNDLRYGYVRQGYQVGGIGVGDYVDIDGLTQPTAQTRNTILHVPVNSIADTLTWSKAAHTIALGGNWRGITNEHSTNSNSFNGAETNPLYADQSDLPNPNNVLGGSFATAWEYAYADLMGIIPELVNVYNYKIASTTSGTALPDGSFVTRDFRSNEFEYFAQDSWHLSNKFNVLFGLRHSLLQTPYEIHGQQISPTIDTDAWYQKRESAALQSQVYEPTIYLAPSGKANGRPAYWPRQKDNIAPRIGVVFAPDAKTSFRASAGMYYDHYGEALVNSFDQYGSYGLSAGIANTADLLGFENSPRFTSPNALPDIPMPPFSPTQTFPYAPPTGGFDIDWGIDNHIKTPYAEAFNFSFQRELPHSFVFEQAYVGRLGRHLLQQLDLAEPVDYVDPQGAGDYFSNARILSKEVDAAPFVNGVKTNPNVPAIPYFEHVFPYMKNTDYAGESATQAIFNNAWAPQRYTNGETLALAILDVFGIFPGSPNSGPGAPPSTFWSNQFSSLYSLSSMGNSSYNALQWTLRHPTTHGLTLDGSYTFSKSLDLGSETERATQFNPGADAAFTNTAIQNTWNPKLNKGPSDFDTHSLVTGDWVYVLPFGRGRQFGSDMNRFTDAFIGAWQFSGLARWTSGLPFTLESPAYPTNYNNPGFGIVATPVQTRRNITGGVPHVFDAATASAIGSGIYYGSPVRLPYAGEAGERNNFRGDGFFDIDSALTKNWSITEKMTLKLAAEAYNISNTGRFDPSPVGLAAGTANPNLGAYSATLTTYRRMQFGLRLDF